MSLKFNNGQIPNPLYINLWALQHIFVVRWLRWFLESFCHSAPAKWFQNRHLRNDSRRRSLSFGNKPSESNLVWKEKTPPSVNNQINKPHSSPVVRHATITPEAQQQLHEEILSKLHDVTMKYVNVPDPVEREARRQQVLEGERHNLTAERAASLLA